MTSGNITLSGVRTYTNFTLSGTATIIVAPYNGTANSGFLDIRASYIRIDSGATITAKGAGYKTLLCHDGSGPTEFPLGGGRGGCSVRDSGGGGGHFGSGGPGTADCQRTGGSTPCWFPYDYEENCNGTFSGNSCANLTSCRQGKGKNQDGGKRWTHNIYSSLGMGASGGDKGCRDGDGWSSGVIAGGAGGGKIVLNSTGRLEVYGKITAQGNRGCGDGNDSGGGGAGGSIILLATSQLLVGATSVVTVEGGKGGDSQTKTDPECAGSQMGGTCDDCGGGGGGGLIFVRGASGNYRTYRNIFVANGGIGGYCDVCNLRAQGEFGWIQFDSDGEVCNGEDDTFDGVIDELQPLLQCGTASCQNGARLYCPPLFG